MRPLYDWLLANLPVPSKPQQIESPGQSHLTVMSKRKLLQLVVEKHVDGGTIRDADHRPAFAGGLHAGSVRDFCERVGVAKKESIIDLAPPRASVREDLNGARSGCGGARPLKSDHREPAERIGRSTSNG